MWKIPTFLDELKKLSVNELVGEIIMIDNTDTGIVFEESIPKLIHIKEFCNTYISAAWNKGVRLSNYDKLLILNDDVQTNYDIIGMIYDTITEDYGMIGAGESCWKPHYNPKNEFAVEKTDHRTSSYASFFFIHRNSYKMIPEKLRVWYGDDWLFANTGKPNIAIQNWFIDGESSQTSNLPMFDEVKREDWLWYKKILDGEYSE